jgi:hypothetical protein
MSSSIPVYIKGKDEVVLLSPAPVNQIVHGDQEEIAPPKILPNGIAKASAKSAKVALVLDPLSITRVNSEGKKQTRLVVTVGAMKFDVMVNSKSYRKALIALDELGADNCTVIIQASMPAFGKLEAAGLSVQPKAPKSEAMAM